MSFLVMSTTALALGPILGWLLRASAMGLQVLDGFVIVSIIGVCAGHMLPEALTSAGPWALATLAAGFLVPGAVEHTLVRSPRRTHLMVLMVATVGLVLHAALDGAALAGVHDHAASAVGETTGVALAWGVLLHRIPVSLMIWWAFRPQYGAGPAVAVLLALAGGTVGGYLAAHDVVQGMSGSVSGHVLALIAGSLLHVILHQTGPEGLAGRVHPCPRWAGFGGLAALGLGLWSAAQGGPAQQATLHAFLELLLESAPALVLGFLAAGLVHNLLPEAGMDWLRGGGVLGQSLKGMAFGLPLPICSCGVVPVYQSLVRRGAPVAAAIAFLVATPEVGLDAVLLSLPLLGARVTGVRLVAAMGVALVAGVLLGLVAPAAAAPAPAATPEDPCCASTSCCEKAEHPGLAERLRAAWQYGAVELVDHTGPWVLLGLAAAAIAAPALDLRGLAGLPATTQVVLMTLVGMPLYVCAAGATPVAAVLIAKGVSPGAAIAFLLAGPVTNVTTFGVLSRLHGRRTASLFVAVLVAACVGAGLLTDLLGGPDLGVGASAALSHSEHGWVAHGAAVLVALAALSALLRQGPRGLADQILGAADSHDHAPAEASPPPGRHADIDPGRGHHGHGCEEAVPAIPHDHGCGHDHGCDDEQVVDPGSPS